METQQVFDEEEESGTATQVYTEDDGEELRVSGSTLHVRSLWFDEDRPRRLRMDENTVTLGDVNLDFLALRQNQGRVLDEDLPEIELEDYRATNVY